MSGSPVVWSRSRTGGGPPSGTSAVKNRLTENVEHGGEATIAANTPAEQRSSSLEYTESSKSLLEEGGDAVRTMERPRKEEKSCSRRVSGFRRVRHSRRQFVLAARRAGSGRDIGKPRRLVASRVIGV
eukprot:6183000-Pleurochrysis_carterae.AAC.3